MNSVGGGVAILYDSKYTALSVDIPAQFNHVELCAIDIHFHSALPIRIFNCYRPPAASNRDLNAIAYITDLCQCIDTLMPKTGSVMVCGDFNFPTIDWSSLSCALHSCSHTCTGIFIDFVLKHGFTQLVESPTHGNNILDLVLCNDINCILNTTVTVPFSTSDHNMVITNLILSDCAFIHDAGSNESLFYDFNRADWDSIRSYLASYDFNALFNSDLSSSEIFEFFYGVLHNCLNLYVPSRHAKLSSSAARRKYPSHIRKLLNRKLVAWRVYRRTRKSDHLAAYKARAAACRSAINKCIAERESKLVDSGNLGAFYRYANGKLSSRSTVGPLISRDGHTLTNPSEKAELLNEYFRNNFTVDNGTIPVNQSPNELRKSTTNLTNITFTPFLVERAIKKLKNKTTCGPDKIPAAFLKQCSRELCAPLANLFMQSFEFSYLPPIWLTALITPIFKKGSHTDPANYRPIALTSTLSKLMETIIKDQTLNYLMTNNLITKEQHGFIKKHSTATNLLESTNDWLLSLNSSKSTDVIYVDFSKAFDSIVFSKLIHKLQWYGLNGNLLRWVSQFLHGRTQTVSLDGIQSTSCDVVSGVPQGSVLGPILFLLFINDICQICENGVSMKLFADDAKLYTELRLNDDSLQRSLDGLSVWCSDWQLSINISKCCVLSLRNKNKSLQVISTYSINGTLLKSSKTVLDLGITITNSVDFKTHVCNIVSKAMQRCSVLFRGFTSRDPVLLKRAFITYIRPLLEYNCILWNPTDVYLTNLLENVQRKFTKRIPSLSNLSYTDRLTSLSLDSLEHRRLKFDLINYFKILSLNFNPELANRFVLHHPPNTVRSTVPRLVCPTNAKQQLSSSFFFRQIHVWNNLPETIKSAHSLNSFKARLHKTNLSNFLIGSGVKQ